MARYIQSCSVVSVGVLVFIYTHTHESCSFVRCCWICAALSIVNLIYYYWLRNLFFPFQWIILPSDFKRVPSLNRGNSHSHLQLRFYFFLRHASFGWHKMHQSASILPLFYALCISDDAHSTAVFLVAVTHNELLRLALQIVYTFPHAPPNHSIREKNTSHSSRITSNLFQFHFIWKVHILNWCLFDWLNVTEILKERWYFFVPFFLFKESIKK